MSLKWIKILSDAIEYVEKNLTNEISVKEVSSTVHISSSHFQQIFRLVTDMTIGDYIRNRRLSLAGQELLKPDSKIIDIAVQYQYDTQEGFSKAFARFHGISPSDARKRKDKLKNFKPLSINIIVQGGFNTMRTLIDNLPLDIPFSGFCGTTFINCFSTVFMFLENDMQKSSNKELDVNYTSKKPSTKYPKKYPRWGSANKEYKYCYDLGYQKGFFEGIDSGLKNEYEKPEDIYEEELNINPDGQGILSGLDAGYEDGFADGYYHAWHKNSFDNNENERQKVNDEVNELKNSNDSDSQKSIQERYFMLFDTMCGRSSLRCRYDDRPTKAQKLVCEMDFYDGGADNNVDFLFGLAGYNYKKIDSLNDFESSVIKSINSGIPLIAKVKDGSARFRVIVGYDEDSLISPYYTNAQHKPENPAYDDIEVLYLIEEKTKPRYTAKDALKRIQMVMQNNIDTDLWGEYIEKSSFSAFFELSIEDRKKLTSRIEATMWHTFNCHNFASALEYFRDKNTAQYKNISDLKKLEDAKFFDLFNEIINHCYDSTHALAWSLIAVNKTVVYNGDHSESFLGAIIERTLKEIKDIDIRVFEKVNQITDMV